MADPRPVAGAPAVPQPDDWTVAATDRIVSTVEAVRDRTTVPVQKAARAVVYGTLAGVAGIVALLMAVVGVLRLHVYWWFHPEGRKVWITYAALSVVFLIAGSILWNKRVPRTR
jgi:hypothetical protein